MLQAALRPSADDEEPAVREDVDRAAARALVRGHAPSSARTGPIDLPVPAVGELLAAYGIEILPSQVVDTVEDAVAAATATGFPVALKSTDPVLRHRADLGGVRLEIPDAIQLRHAYEAMRRDLSYSSATLEVQAMAPAGVPMVVRSVEDPSLGPVVSLSVAGDATDLLDDIAYAIRSEERRGGKERA